MNPRVFIACAAGIICIALLAAAFIQHGQLADLRADQEHLLASATTAPSIDQTSRTDADAASTGSSAASAPSAPSGNLLKLRNQVSQLTDRKRQLLDVRAENERLRAQLAARGTNAAAGSVLPPGFIRKTDAQWVGTGKPEDTFQSALWALHHRRIDDFLALLEPGSAAKLREQIGNSPEKFFEDASGIPAMRIVNQQNFGAATVKAQLELGPDDRVPRNIFFFLLDGQWKIVLENPNARFTP